MEAECFCPRINFWTMMLFSTVSHPADCIDTLNCTMYVSMRMCTICHVVHMHWIMDKIPWMLMGLEILVPNLIHRYICFVCLFVCLIVCVCVRK